MKLYNRRVWKRVNALGPKIPDEIKLEIAKYDQIESIFGPILTQHIEDTNNFNIRQITRDGLSRIMQKSETYLGNRFGGNITPMFPLVVLRHDPMRVFAPVVVNRGSNNMIRSLLRGGR